MTTTTRIKVTGSKAAGTLGNTTDVDLVIPSKVTSSKAAGILGDTTDVDLVTPSAGMTTQRDANVSFDNRLTALEPMLTAIDGGTY